VVASEKMVSAETICRALGAATRTTCKHRYRRFHLGGDFNLGIGRPWKFQDEEPRSVSRTEKELAVSNRAMNRDGKLLSLVKESKARN